MSGLLDDAARERCGGCAREIDAAVCWCGAPMAEHGFRSGHAAVPMGCVCYYDEGPGEEDGTWAEGWSERSGSAP